MLVLVVATVGSAQAAVGPWVSKEAVRARLVAATDGVGQDREIHAGLQISLDDGWETYWRSPGDAGAAPQADWSGSGNVGAVDWRWPAPTRLTLFGLETFGYRHDVLFPLTIHPQRAGEPISVQGKVELLVCSKICVPRTLVLTLDLPAGAATADPEASNLIARADAQVPDDGTRSGLTVDDVAVVAEKPGILKIRLSSREPLAAPDVIVESPKWTYGAAKLSFGADRKTATAALSVTSGPDAVGMSGAPVTVTVIDGTRASESRRSVARATASGGNWFGELLPFLALALIGGLILNLMPCVLPVLSLKLLAVLRHQGQARRQIRVGFVATAAGVVTSMLAIGAVLAGLKASGTAVGWGLQFQQPLFLAFLAGVLIVFAANLAGMFEFALPARLSTALSAIGGQNLSGGFLAGVFTTLLATPCSAPFVGTAIAFALARGPAEILAIFGALGIGLAAPHLLVAAFPALTRALPRPGQWMRLVRFVLASALAGTTVWLLTILAAETSWESAAAIAVAFVVLVVVLTVRQRIGAAVTATVVALVLIAAAAAPAIFAAAPSRAATTAWLPFDDGAIRRLVAEGQVVFVDVTADWCVTCHANKVLVIDSSDVAKALAQPHTTAMLADWTKPDSRISDYLTRNSRYGIPFNAVYGPGAPRGIVLSELLTRQAVLDALRRARNSGEVSSR